MENRTTLVIGASENPERYAYKAIKMLRAHQIETFAYGNKAGKVGDVDILTDQKMIAVDTVTLYLGPKNQESIKDYILGLKPRRVIFNPGTENPDWYPELSNYGIQYEEACTLVLLSTNSY
jgi:predicted CoA-binding protein